MGAGVSLAVPMGGSCHGWGGKLLPVFNSVSLLQNPSSTCISLRCLWRAGFYFSWNFLNFSGSIVAALALSLGSHQ